MAERRDWLLGIVARLSIVPAGLAWLLFGLRESALAVPVDVVETGAWVSVAGAALGGIVLVFAGKGATRPLSAGLAIGAVTASLVALVTLLGSRSLAYTAEDLSFSSDGAELWGTLYLPRAPGPHPAVVLVHGSGPATRRDHRFYAGYLAKRGIAALAYDKRGVGESNGELYGSGYGDYAADAAAGVRLLATRPEIDATGIGIVGFSEGEWVGPLAATRSDAVAFLVVVGASGLSPAAQVSSEIAHRLRSHGHSDSAVNEALELNERVFDYHRTGSDREELQDALDRARSEPWFADADDIPKQLYPADDYAWWRSVMDFDPDPVWRDVSVPVLLLKGGDDDRSRPDEMRRRVSQALAAGGRPEPTVHVFPGADHMILEWPLGHRTPPPTFADGYLDTLVAWVRRVTEG